MSAIRAPRGLVAFASLVTAGFWLSCVAVPVGAIIFRLSHSVSLWDPEIVSIAVATARQAILSTAISALIGIPLGLYCASASRRLLTWIDALLLIPSGVPTVVAATAWVAWLGRSGWLARAGLPADLAYSLQAVIIAHVFFNAPWIALLVSQGRRQISSRPIEAARTLGAGKWAVFRWVLWPELRWSCFAACAQVLALCSMSFALVLLLGGGPPVETLETSLYFKLRTGSLDLSAAAVCAFWELALTLPPWILVLTLRSRRNGQSTDAVTPLLRRDQGVNQGVKKGWLALALALFFLLPYFVVFFPSNSVEPSPWRDWAFWSAVREPLQLSLEIAVLTSLGTVSLAVLGVLSTSAYPRLSGLLALPSGISVLVLGLGAWLAYGSFIDPFNGSLTAIVVLQVTVFFPLAYRMLWPVAQRTRRRLLETALTLGASPWNAFRYVEGARWRGPLFSALALVAGCALGEVAAVSLFYSENLIPLPLLLSRWMGQYRFEEARAASALLFSLSAALMGGVMVFLGHAADER